MKKRTNSFNADEAIKKAASTKRKNRGMIRLVEAYLVFLLSFFLKRRAYASRNLFLSFPVIGFPPFFTRRRKQKKTLCKKRKCFFTSLENVFFVPRLHFLLLSLSLCGVHVSVAVRLAVKYLDAAVKKRRKILAL